MANGSVVHLDLSWICGLSQGEFTHCIQVASEGQDLEKGDKLDESADEGADPGCMRKGCLGKPLVRAPDPRVHAFD